jgi:hypothetical protein
MGAERAASAKLNDQTLEKILTIEPLRRKTISDPKALGLIYLGINIAGMAGEYLDIPIFPC